MRVDKVATEVYSISVTEREIKSWIEISKEYNNTCYVHAELGGEAEESP